MEDFDDFNIHDEDVRSIWREDVTPDEKLVKLRAYYEPIINRLEERKNSLASEVRSLSGQIAKQNKRERIITQELGRLTAERLLLEEDVESRIDATFDKALEEAKKKRLAREAEGGPNEK